MRECCRCGVGEDLIEIEVDGDSICQECFELYLEDCIEEEVSKNR